MLFDTQEHVAARPLVSASKGNLCAKFVNLKFLMDQGRCRKNRRRSSAHKRSAASLPQANCDSFRGAVVYAKRGYANLAWIVRRGGL